MFGIDVDAIKGEVNVHLKNLTGWLSCIHQEAKSTAQNAGRTAAVLEREFGAAPADFPVRRVTALPVEAEGETTEDKELKLQDANQGVPVTRGYYSNLGDAAFKVRLIALDGTESSGHTVPPGASVEIRCALRGLRIIPTADGPAQYSVLGY